MSLIRGSFLMKRIPVYMIDDIHRVYISDNESDMHAYVTSDMSTVAMSIFFKPENNRKE